MKWEREDGAVGPKQQQGGASRVTLLCHPWDGSHPWDSQELLYSQATLSKSFLTKFCCPSISKELPGSKPTWPWAGGSWWPKSVATPGRHCCAQGTFQLHFWGFPAANKAPVCWGTKLLLVGAYLWIPAQTTSVPEQQSCSSALSCTPGNRSLHCSSSGCLASFWRICSPRGRESFLFRPCWRLEQFSELMSVLN